MSGPAGYPERRNPDLWEIKTGWRATVDDLLSQPPAGRLAGDELRAAVEAPLAPLREGAGPIPADPTTGKALTLDHLRRSQLRERSGREDADQQLGIVTVQLPLTGLPGASTLVVAEPNSSEGVAPPEGVAPDGAGRFTLR